MLNAGRLRACMEREGLSQSELGRRVGLSQQNIGWLLSGEAQGSKKLHRIAEEVRTTPAYLMGETDDPDANAPAPRAEPDIQHLMLPVALPSERALTQMFAALLEGLPKTASLDERAQLLARRLPIGLSQARDLLPTPPTSARASPRAGASRQKELLS